MKKTYTLLLAAFLTVSSFAQLTFPGNGKISAGGPVGLGNLELRCDSVDLTVIFNKGTNDLSDAVVIYIQPASNRGLNLTSTADLVDATDNLTKAICGFDGGTNRSTINFTTNKFRPGFAIAFQPGDVEKRVTVAALVPAPGLLTQSSHPSLNNGTNPSAPSFSFAVKLKDIGIKSGDVIDFKFFATYINTTTGRSDETVGDPADGFTPGWNNFTQTADPLLFSATLPVVFGDFTGAFAGKNVQLNWNTTTEINTRQFDVQKSADGTAWRSIGTLPTQNSSTGARYSYLDNNVSDATTYYQIKLTDNDGAISYSPVIIMRKDAVSGITLLGNPARGIVNLNISNSNAGKYNIELYSVDGRRIASQVYNHIGGSGKVSIAVPGSVKGTCVVKITNGNEKQSMKVVVQ